MNQLFKNVFIRWDKHFEKQSLDVVVNSEYKLDNEAAEIEVSEIVIMVGSEHEEKQKKVTFDIDTGILEEEIERLRGDKDLGKYFNYAAPVVQIARVNRKPGGLFLNHTLTFKWDCKKDSDLNK